MPHTTPSSVFTTSGLNQRFKGDKGEAGARGEQGSIGVTGGNGPANMLINIQTASYTLVFDDLNIALVAMSVGTSNTLTIPPNTEVAFPIGAQIMVTQDGLGSTSIAAGAGVTILSIGGALIMGGQYAGATMIQKEINVWYLFGNIS
jgi:hypothetical protein